MPLQPGELCLLRIGFLNTETTETTETMETSVVPQGHPVWGQVSFPTQPRTVPMDTMTPFRKTYS